MRIDNNALIYARHFVICDPLLATPEVMIEMAQTLSLKGSAAQHARELTALNQDSMWGIYAQVQGPTSRWLWIRRRARRLFNFYRVAKTPDNRRFLVREAAQDWRDLNGIHS